MRHTNRLPLRLLRRLLLCALLLGTLLLPAAPAAADADPSLDAAAITNLLQGDASAPDLNALTKTLGQRYTISFTAAGQPLRDAGIPDRALRILPPEAVTAYKTFTTEAAFDPIERFEGALVAADAPSLDALDDAERMLIVASFSGALPPQALAAFDKADSAPKKDKKTKKTKHRQEVVALIALSPDQQKAIAAELLANALKSDPDARAVDVGPNAHLVIRSQKKKEAHGYAYVWSRGIILASIPALPSLDEAALKLAAAQTLHRLHDAATAPAPTDPIQALTLRAPIPDGDIKLSLLLNDTFTLSGTAVLSGPLLEKSKQFLLGVAIIKADPLAFLDKKVPPMFHPLATLLINGTEVTTPSPEAITFTTTAPTAQLMSEVDALIKALGR